MSRDEVQSLENYLFAYPLPRANIVNDHSRGSNIPAMLEWMFARTRNPALVARSGAAEWGRAAFETTNPVTAHFSFRDSPPTSANVTSPRTTTKFAPPRPNPGNEVFTQLQTQLGSDTPPPAEKSTPG